MIKFLYPLMILLALTGCSSPCVQKCEPEPIEAVPCTDPILNVQLKLKDKRWCKEGGYGMDRVSIYINEDIGELINDFVVEQFECRNFIAGETGPTVEIDVEEFLCDVIQRKTFWNCMSQIILTVKVVSNCGEVLYNKRIQGHAENDFDMCERYGKAKRALNTALEDALSGFLEGRSFRRAVCRG